MRSFVIEGKDYDQAGDELDCPFCSGKFLPAVERTPMSPAMAVIHTEPHCETFSDPSTDALGFLRKARTELQRQANAN